MLSSSLSSQIKNGINYNYIDYRKPVNVLGNDLRTSTYLGHRYFKQNDVTIPPMHSILSPSYTLQQKEIRYDYATEQASQYTPKYNFSRTNKANLYICCSKPAFVKSMQHRIFSSPPRPINNSSSHSRDYVNRPQKQSDYVILNRNSYSGQLPRNVDIDEEGNYKYDSTNKTVYKPPEGVRVPPGCSKDTITVWNYIQAPKFKASDKPNYKIVGNRPLFLKHYGMKSENQSSFIVPVPKKFQCSVLTM